MNARPTDRLATALQVPRSARVVTAVRAEPAVLRQLNRAAAAVFGGYAVALAFTVLLSFGLPLLAGMARHEALMTAALLAFLVQLAAVLRAFCVSAARAWAELLVVGMAMAGLGLACRALLPQAS
jgi:hypothetical protein